MNYKVKIKNIKKDYYDLEITTYKDVLKGTFERSELRNLIEVIDNAID